VSSSGDGAGICASGGRSLEARIATRVLLLVYVVFALCLVFLVPPYEAPDEPSHVHYATFIATRGELPNQLDPARRVEGQGHQGPLAYIVMAGLLRLAMPDGDLPVRIAPNRAHAWNGGTALEVPLFDPTRPAFASDRERAMFYGLRLLSVLYGLLTLVVLERTVRMMGADATTAFVAVLLPATLPQFVYVSAYVTADGLLILLATLTAHEVVRVARAPDRLGPYVGLGIALGAALLVKKTALFLLPGVGLTLLALVATGRARFGDVVRHAAVMAGAAVAVSGGLFVRNTVVYGDPLGSGMERATLSTLMQPRSLWDPYFADYFPRILSASFVGLLGWVNVWLPAPVYWLYAVLGGLAAIGVVVRRGDPWVRLAATFAALCFLGIVVFNLTFPQPQGRYLFAALPFLAFLVAIGLRVVTDRLSLPPWPTAVGLLATMVSVDVITVGTVRQFFAR
jgi:4-amino-4-deoxy-L-arabinose transferase-like glycosyltransferase